MIEDYVKQHILVREKTIAKANDQHIQYLIAKIRLWRIERKLWKY